MDRPAVLVNRIMEPGRSPDAKEQVSLTVSPLSTHTMPLSSDGRVESIVSVGGPK